MSAERTRRIGGDELRLLAAVRGPVRALDGRPSLLLADRLLDKRIDSQRHPQCVPSAGGEVR